MKRMLGGVVWGDTLFVKLLLPMPSEGSVLSIESGLIKAPPIWMH